MPNVFKDQAAFMKAGGQTVGETNAAQFGLYKKLIKEEYTELVEATCQIEELDALIDILVTTIGAIHSMGADAEGAWKEVMRSNFSKIDKETGMVRKREDGKIMKPVGYSPPDLAPFLKR